MAVAPNGQPFSFVAFIDPETGLPSSGAGSVDWADITGKPATFPATTPVATATALATGRTIALTGGATGTSAAFTGAANASIAVTLATPTGSVRGGVLQQTAVADLAAPPTETDFNGLLAKLRAAGVLAT